MPITDTSWLYAFVDELDKHHDDAISQAKRAEQLVVPAAVLTELLQLIHYRVRKSGGDAQAHRAGRQVLRDLEATAILAVLERTDLKTTSRIFLRHPKLSYVDAVGIGEALRGRDELLSFDKVQLAALAKERET